MAALKILICGVRNVYSTTSSSQLHANLFLPDTKYVGRSIIQEFHIIVNENDKATDIFT